MTREDKAAGWTYPVYDAYVAQRRSLIAQREVELSVLRETVKGLVKEQRSKLMENFVRCLVFGALLWFTAAVQGATYYFDYTGGNDANNGTSTATPKKHHFYMRSYAGPAYSHAAGDRFIFKGGVTWPHAAFYNGVGTDAPNGGLKITAGGSSDSVRDYYGATNNWFSGGSFTRPVFDFENTALGTWGGWSDGAGILLRSVSYVTIDNLEIKRHRSALASADWGNCTINIYNSNFITTTNCYIHDWSVPTITGSGVTGGGEGGIFNTNGGGNGIRTEGCTFTQINSANVGGRAISHGGVIRGNTIYRVGTAILGSGTIQDNHIYDLQKATDAAAHQNVIYTMQPSTISGNLIHDIVSGIQVIYPSPGFLGQSGIDLIYNNVVYNTGNIPVTTDMEGSGNFASCGTRVFNNTIVGVGGTGYCVKIGVRIDPTTGNPISNWGSFDSRNNHFITSGTAMLYNNVAAGGANVTTVTTGSNTSQTVAAANAAGYNIGNQWQPTTGATTIGAGVDLSAFLTTDRLGIARPQGGTWDTGAYEFETGAGSAGTLAFSASEYSTAEDTSLTITVTRTVGTAGAVAVSYATSNGTALAGTDYTATSGTLNFADSDASEAFNVPILRNVAYTGNRNFTVTLSSPTGGAILGGQSTAMATITDTETSPSSIPELGLSFPVTDMLVLEPFVISGSAASQPVETTSTNNAGQLQAYFVITQAGTYQMRTGVSAPNTGSDSFQVRINGTNDVFDIIPLTVGTEDRWVNWRGSGTFDAPEFQPVRWTFGVSTNLLVIYGRERDTSITDVEFVLQDSPPPAPQQIYLGSSTAYVYQNGTAAEVFVLRVGTTGAISADYTTANQTAIAGIDYTTTSGTVSFAAGETSKIITIPVVDHPSYTGTKIFTLTLSNPTGADLADPSVISIAILDDTLPITLTPSQLDLRGPVRFEGTITFR